MISEKGVIVLDICLR